MTAESIAQLTKLCSLRAATLCYDEIAVNTSMLQEVPAKRKIPAVGKVMAGSLAIKMAVIPASLLVTAFAPGVIPILLMFGGFHLASEGLKSLLNKEQDRDNDGKDDATGKSVHKLSQKEFEKNTIKKVLIIDGLLSVEIAVMTLPIIAGAAPLVAAAALAATGLIRVGWMYGLIGSVINMPRVGDWLSKRKGDNPVTKGLRQLGKGMTKVNPYIVKGFRIAGTVALLVIGGGLVLHGVAPAAHLVTHALGVIATNGIVNGLLEHAVSGAIGIAAGFVASPVLDKLYEGIGKAARKLVVNPVKSMLGKKKKGAGPQPKPSNDNVTPAAAPASNAPTSGLQSAPDAKAALNTAAKPVAEQPPASSPAKPEKKIANGPGPKP